MLTLIISNILNAMLGQDYVSSICVKRSQAFFTIRRLLVGHYNFYSMLHHAVLFYFFSIVSSVWFGGAFIRNIECVQLISKKKSRLFWPFLFCFSFAQIKRQFLTIDKSELCISTSTNKTKFHLPIQQVLLSLYLTYLLNDFMRTSQQLVSNTFLLNCSP